MLFKPVPGSNIYTLYSEDLVVEGHPLIKKIKNPDKYLKSDLVSNSYM